MTERTINAERVEQLIDVFGSFDENIRKIEDAFGVRITNRNNELKVSGDEEAADKGCRAIEALLALAAKGEEIDEQKVRYLINLVNTGNEDQVSKIAKDVVCVTAKGRPVKAKTIGQQNYLKAIEKNTITIGVGPAGTGKTYLAVAEAVAAFRAKTVNRIILTRPAVEAGERLGFLQVARQKAELLPRLDGGAGQDDAADILGLERLDRHGSGGEAGLSARRFAK